MKVRKYILAVFLISFIYSCSFSPAPRLVQFSINNNVKIHFNSVKGNILRKTTVNIVMNCPDLFNDLSIYVKRNNEFLALPNVSWIEPPCYAIKNIIKSAFLDLGVKVVDYGKTNYTIFVNLNRFYGIEFSKSNVISSVCLSFKVRDNSDGKLIINSKDLCDDNKLGSVNPDKLVLYLNNSLSYLIKKFLVHYSKFLLR